MPLVHHTDSTFTGREVVAGVALDFSSGSAVVPELNAAAEAVLTAVKGWSITGEIPDAAPVKPARTRKASPVDADDIHAEIEVAPEDEA